MKILYISTMLKDAGTGGAHVSNGNYHLLEKLDLVSECSSIDCSGFEGVAPLRRRILIFIRSVFGFSSSLGFFKSRALLRSRKMADSDVIWLDGSLYGPLLVAIKKRYPDKKIITFFHNVESDLYRSIFKERSFLYLALIWSAFSSERKSLIYSDIKIAMTDVDSRRLEKIYKISADYVLPAFYERGCETSQLIRPVASDSSYILFVGSDFPPNIEALEFLAKNVMPYLPKKKLMVVGKGLDRYRKRFESDNILVKGFVDDLGAVYANSSIVVAPIFSGSGMKVKVVEALMYGKHIIGTDFSFIGFRRGVDTEDFLLVANSAQEYVELLSLDYKKSSRRSMEYFERYYSFDSQLSRIEVLMNNVL